jgi:putative hydrolase of the HAD superfamily
MLTEPVEPLPGVDETLAELSKSYRLVLITKGDLLHQEQKLAASGLGDLFAAVEIVSEKDASTYSRVFARHGTGRGAGGDVRQLDAFRHSASRRGRALTAPTSPIL